MSSECIIIGASHAGAELAVSLRQSGWEGGILVVGEENFLPYQRPPLSKDFMFGEKSELELLIRPPELYSKLDIHFLLNTRALHIDREQKTVTTQTAGETEIQHRYDKLALCVGSRVRRLNIVGGELPGVYYMRTLRDAEAIKAAAADASRAVIVGGGYIGLESAAMLRKCGLDVTVLETAPRVLARVTAPEVSAFYQRVHEEEGVRILTGITIDEFLGDDRFVGVRLGDGSTLEADFAIVGVGVVPNTELAENAGLAVDNGIAVDQFAQTSDAHIVAVGDCTNHPHPQYGMVRLESVPNATEQAKTAAATLCGKQKAHDSLPWFWSDQYDMKLQIAGLSQGYDQVVLRGNNTLGRHFAAFYLCGGTLLAADCINRPKEFMFARRCIGKAVDSAKLSDEAVDLRELMQT